MLIDESGHRIDYKELTENIVFYGASTRNQRAIDELNITDRVLFFADGDRQKAGQKFDSYQIESIEALTESDNITVVSVLIEHMQEVLKTLHDIGKRCIFYVFEKFDIEGAVESNHEILSADRTYRYIHFFPYEKFLRPFYDMAENEMNIEEHLFVVDVCMEDKYGVFKYIKQKNKSYNNILIFDDIHNISHVAEENINCNMMLECSEFNNILQSADKILLHSAFFGYHMQKSLSQWADVYGNKMVWICWGGDSYYNGDEYVVQHVLKKAAGAYSAKADIDRIWLNYEIRAKFPEGASYCYSPHNLSICDNKDCKHILLGHSAAEYGNHIAGLKLLYKFRYEDIKIYCPLSYGNADYRDMVILNGKDLFGDKFIPITEFMETEQYYTFLNSIDVAVMPMTRMAGATNLAYLSSIGKKIYISCEMMYKFESMSIHANDIELIKEQSFEEFIRNDAGDGDAQKFNAVNVAAWIKILNE